MNMFNNMINWKNWILTIVIMVPIFIYTNNINACTVFCIDSEGMLVTGRSYDWSFGEGYIMINKRGQFKTAFTYWEENKNNLASWTSKYGSVTFVQYGREIAFDGMNEAGLVVSELWLEESVYPSADTRSSISLDQYVQYLLDNFSTVDEIISSDTVIRIRPTPSGFTKIHFFIADSSDNCMVVEFLNGKMVYHTKDSMPVKAITNNTYESSINYINRGVPPNTYSLSSLERFYCASNMISEYKASTSGDIVPYVFQILDAVKQGSWTKFQTSFDIKNRVVYFKSQQNWQLRYFRFDAFDFSCQNNSKILDINANLSGDVTDKFTDYTWQANEALIKTAWEGLGDTNVYPPALQIISRYPETFKCNGSTDIDKLLKLKPQKIKLNQNYPNPFNPTTTIQYSFNQSSQVRLIVYNLLGQKVRTLVDSFQNSGEHSIVWSGTDELKNNISSGTYFYGVEINKGYIQKKMVLIK
jgi:choloylglycine hydrolase